MSETFTFPPASSPDAIEWAGTPIGAANCITRTRTRTAVHDKSIDRLEGRRDALVNAAVSFVTRKGKPLYRHDVIIHGVRVRATTNSAHLHDFWVDNWYSPDEWKSITGLLPSRDPQVTVFALGGVGDQPEAAYYSRKTNTILFFNTAYYGQLKSWVLGAVGRVLAEEFGIHSIHGACVDKDGRGVLYIAPTGTGKSTSSYGLMHLSRTRFHSDDWVYVRYAYATRDGRRIHPMRVTLPGGRELQGYPVFRWLETASSSHADATITGLDLEHREVTVPVTAIDFASPVEAYAFTSEKIFYLRTNLVENFPLSAMQMLRSKMENVPDVSPAFLTQRDAMLNDLVEAIRAEGGEVTQYFAEHSRDEVKQLLARMIAFDNARAMLDVSKVLPAERVFINPMEPTKLSTVILLRRAKDDRTVAESLGLGGFAARLLIGETPDKKREIAYNAYRAVDDAEEQAFVTSLEEEARRAGPGGDDRLYELFERRGDVPETLREEFELFRVMHRACRCYSLNTILTADPQVKDRKEAVELTLQIIARLVDDHPADLQTTLTNYRSLISAPAR
ncbi:MAG: hypothetical protein HYU65_05525 [Armatimonadetes bacterium]|nr:hypothetical protein [Armatimonadota bacterium]